MLAIAGREYASFFRSPLGWVVTALFLCLSGLFFVAWTLVPGGPASMRDFFGAWWSLALIIAPAISMKLVSEELRSGTIEATQTAPVSDLGVVAGKYLAGVGFFVSMLAPTLVYVGVLGWLSRPDYGSIASGYLGLILLGMLYLAVGCVATVLTASQPLAFLGTLFTLLILEVATSRIAPELPERVREAVFAISPRPQAADLYRGLIGTGRVMYFVAAIGWCLMVATLVLQSRRWR